MNSGGSPLVSIVNACLREGDGGSPTAVLDDLPLTDEQRASVPRLMGTSHAVFVSVGEDVPSGAGEGRLLASLRFFTSGGELPACGHGTVAALAHLAARTAGREYEATLSTSGRTFTGRAVRDGQQIRAVFRTGRVDLRDATGAELDLVLAPLGLAPDTLASDPRVASLGRARLLVPVAAGDALTNLAPDLVRLREVCDRLGLLGCCVHTMPTGGRIAARMFAPSIGVPEDIANANSAACLAAQFAGRGRTDIAVDMGDSLGAPSTITAVAESRPTGPVVHVGGHAAISHTRRLDWNR